jgi:hypothetical protein
MAVSFEHGNDPSSSIFSVPGLLSSQKDARFEAFRAAKIEFAFFLWGRGLLLRVVWLFDNLQMETTRPS